MERLNIVVRNFTDDTAGYYAGGNQTSNLVALCKDGFASEFRMSRRICALLGLNKGRSSQVGHYFNVHHTFGKLKVCVASNTDELQIPQCVGTRRMACAGSVAGCVAWRKIVNNELYGLYI
jgi:hypothetical protein